ncbi:MAG: hypothetical protein WBH94_08345, partial [Methanoculleus sp.]
MASVIMRNSSAVYNLRVVFGHTPFIFAGLKGEDPAQRERGSLTPNRRVIAGRSQPHEGCLLPATSLS